MEKIKFGIQLAILMLAFPVLFVTEIKQGDQEMKKNQQEKQELIEAKKPETSEALKKPAPVSDLNMIPGSKLMPLNI